MLRRVAPLYCPILLVLAAFANARTALADDADSLDSRPRILIKAKGSTEWLLGLVGKDLRFFGKRNVTKDDDKLPNVPLAGGLMRTSFGFVQDGRRLRLYVRQDHAGTRARPSGGAWLVPRWRLFNEAPHRSPDKGTVQVFRMVD